MLVLRCVGATLYQTGSFYRFIVAHSIYGIPTTINCANYVYFLAQQESAELSPEAMAIYTGLLL